MPKYEGLAARNESEMWELLKKLYPRPETIDNWKRDGVTLPHVCWNVAVDAFKRNDQSEEAFVLRAELEWRDSRGHFSWEADRS